MNIEYLTDSEFIDFLLTAGSEDPVTQRLIKIITKSATVHAVDELVRAGMDSETWEMNYDGLDVSPAEYIRRLENDIEYRNEEYLDLEYRLEETKKELKQMETRSVSDLIQELRQELRTADYKAQQAELRVREEKDAATQAKNKLNMWAILNR